MEENTEAHMETDVSSTTEDVPETQEVTGSDGNVEMVIVVEKVREEEMNSTVQNDKQPAPVDENTNEVSEPVDKSPENIVPSQKTPIPSPIKTNAEVVPSPSKPELSQKIVNKELELNNEIELSAQTQQIEDADSSSKDSAIVNNDNKSKSVTNSPKTVQTKSTENSPVKEVSKTVHETPVKELQTNNYTVSSPIKDIAVVEKGAVNGKVQSNDAINDSSNKNISTDSPIDITIDTESSNDTPIYVITTAPNSDLSEKDNLDVSHSKGISRELKSLINSAKESKIISECTQLTSKTRKSRSTMESSNTSLNSPVDVDRLHVRRHSNNSQISNCSEKSEKVAVKRSMRSQNPEFVSKVKQFLNSVTGKGQKDSDDEDYEEEEKYNKDKVMKELNYSSSSPSPSKMKKLDAIVPDKTGKLRSDPYCWRCHWAVEQACNDKVHPPMLCTVCPRSFHYKCLSSNERNKINAEKSWVCPECMIVLQAESSETRSPAMKKISLGMLCDLLKHALERMMDLNGVEPFMQPVDRTAFPDYDRYVVHPMDLSLMQANIDEGLYGSTEAFQADVQWILHNSIIFNTLQSKLTGGARALVRSSRAEMGEIEACPECYAAAHARRPTWFTDVCSTPHILLWAKLKGFPYWPAKGMSVSGAGHVDVRFFGAHDRAWVPAKDCFLYSEKDPNNFRTKRQDIIDSMQEAEQHIRNISRKYGKFVYPPFKTQFDPSKLNEQLKMMIPSFEGEVRTPVKDKPNPSPSAAKGKSRSNSKSSKGSMNDGEISEIEDTQEHEQATPVAARKMADGAEIARVDEELTVEKTENNSMDVDISNKVNEIVAQINTTKTTVETPAQSNKNGETSRKRRRSELEEAVITIMESTPIPEAKRRKNDNKQETEKKKPDEQKPSSSKEIENKPETEATKIDVDGEDTSDEIIIDDEPSSSSKSDLDKEKNQRVTPIRIALVQKDKKHNLRPSAAKEAMAKIIAPNKDSEKNINLRQKPSRTDKAGDKTPREEKIAKGEKRRNSRNNRSSSNTPKSDRPRRYSIEKKTDKVAEPSTSKDKGKEGNTSKDKQKETPTTSKEKPKETTNKDAETTKKDKPSTESTKSVKDRLQFDEDKTLAVLARENKTVILSSHTQCLPTISCVRSLSTVAQNTPTTSTKVTTSAKSTEVTIAANSDCIFTPTSTDSVRNMKDATSKLQKLRSDAESHVGRVGVRAFARMTSPERSPNNNKKDDVQVEIKSEPIDVDDADRQVEKLNLMNAFRLRPVNPPPTPTSNLREVRINKVLVTPLNSKKPPAKSAEVRPRAKKTFPQPKKPEDGQLNSKNSMVYIPIQPPMTQAPVRPPRVVTGNTCPPPVAKQTVQTPVQTTQTPNKPNQTVATTTVANSQVNTVTTPVMQVSSVSTHTLTSHASSSVTSTVTTAATSIATVAALGQVPAAVHTVPLMTSVNGQWMFSFQPVMSVGAIENSPSPPILNGLTDRTNNTTIVPLAGGVASPATVASGAIVPTPAVTLQPPAARTPGDTSAPGEPPRLQQRPTTVLLNPLDVNTPIGTMPTPSTAGPLTAKLNQNAVKLTDFFRTLLEDSLEKLDEPATQLTTARLQLEQAKWKHQAEIEEIRHNHELTMAEMRALFEKEKLRAVAEARRSAQVELEAAVKAAKAKQWCANCSQEAQFYCCWNTSYCDYPCQRAHWSQHFNMCTQQRQEGSNNGEPPSPPESRLQPQPDMPKNSSAPALTVGGKLAPTRVFAQDSTNASSTQKNAIIVSMVEDPSGNQTMKCVGTYKTNAPAQNISPIILNKQRPVVLPPTTLAPVAIMNSEENANKKVVSSGGYLIVGGGSNSSAVVTPARRTHTIQYYT
ncbi:MYND-type zinc finger-containing chromatin reader Zmynd8-like isoform X2 [Anticarsia gemmatalis]|uniref:MYND-type zinc finger-containing chromatin reader Zmynd8-like isoform X2 n=1 Tax=Anticarsia gemmatalis TaxID=129554 RepID=UPI003F76E996